MEKIPDEERVAAVYTDSNITISLLKRNTKHNTLIAHIHNTLSALQQRNWTIHFGWVKAHAGLYGNELADRLAKAASTGGEVIYKKIPKSTIKSEISRLGLQKWQECWNNTTKGALSKAFFPSVMDRLKTKLPVTPEFTAIVTGHGKTNSYLHRFHLKDDPACTCHRGQQTVNHLIYECPNMTNQRTILIKEISQNGGTWPVTNQQLTSRHLRAFRKYIQSMNI